MTKNSGLLKVRLALDDAITYGTKKEAKAFARQGLKAALSKKLMGEVEYFKGQQDILHRQFASAIEHFDAAIRYNPKDGAAYNDRALCMVELGIIDEALYYFDKGIEVEPDFATIHHNKGWLLNNIGKHTAALQCFREALRLEPERAVTYDNLADALYNLGDYRGAVEAYKKVLVLLKPGSCRGIRKNVVAQMKAIESKLVARSS